MAHTSLQFTLTSADQLSHFGPRLGTLVLHRPNGTKLALSTPTLLTPTSRGVVPHLSRDHVKQSKAIGWVNVPFETFLEHNPPVPTLQPGPNALHRFLGFVPEQHLVSMSARDPGDVRDMPPNGNNHVSVLSLRGVRKITPAEWRTYTAACQPDIVFALSDTPYTPPPFSQKRLTKSIERSAAWLAALLAPAPAPPPTAPIRETPTPTPSPSPAPSPAVFVHLAGSASHPARAAFAASLIEPLHGPEQAAAGGLPCLDAGVTGYVVDLAPLRLAAAASPSPSRSATTTSVTLSSDADIITTTTTTTGSVPASTDNPLAKGQTQTQLDVHPPPPAPSLPSLMHTSLLPLPRTKPRLATGTEGPHDVLRLIRDVGIDALDARWAVEWAGWGVALDFVFPVPVPVPVTSSCMTPIGKQELGRNLYDAAYALDFHGLSSSSSACDCDCAACAPRVAPRIVHGSDPSEDASPSAGTSQEPGAGAGAGEETTKKAGYTRAYIHHLLQTHEMSAHALLVLHNLSVVDRLLAGVRAVLSSRDPSASPSASPSEGKEGKEGKEEGDTRGAAQAGKRFEEEVRRFEETYAEEGGVVRDARRMWREVDMARGKGRLARERERERQGAPSGA
ncbi:putative queuine tRNA-ribosyltransferase [Lyophyllum shimeji]|uniref:Queuine tRNA-ribosyltransferase n=1 Tax=Lyophyllum shimeji TaxID=47721 RepID=A0A9P3PQ82_LYOSH|nr:putative queuine tRNA-ribosyltransferase [Lyophyllum shimeji]